MILFKKRGIAFIIVMLAAISLNLRAQEIPDSVTTLEELFVKGRTSFDNMREAAYSASAVDIKGKLSTTSDIAALIDRVSGVKVRREGGLGSDYDLSVNGMSGNSIRYFIDGVPLESLGYGIDLASLPVAMIDHIEIYKGVVPGNLAGDILGGAVNMITRRKKHNYLDVTASAGSFHTYGFNLNGMYSPVENGLIFKPSITINSAKNDYMMKGVEVWDEESRKYINVNRRRFHDRYFLFSGRLEGGVENKSWADELLFSLNYTLTDKELQTGSIQSKVYGDATRDGHSFGFGATYRKRGFLTGRLNLAITLNQSFDRSVTTDTAMRKYDWNGHYIYSPRNEITGRAASIRHYSRPATVGTFLADYSLFEFNKLTFNYLYNRVGNKRRDDVDNEFEPSNDYLTKHIASLSWDGVWINERLSTSLFYKNYITHYTITQTDLASVTGSSSMMGNTTKYYPGYGLAARFNMIERLFGMKLSVENSVRLPSSREMLGNGSTVYANVALKPERSYNFNLGVFGECLFDGGHSVNYEVGGFMRLARDYIRAAVAEKEGMMQYVNEPSVHIKGVEAEVAYFWRDKLHASANISYQDSRDRRRYLDDGNPSATFNNRVPNKPWCYGHAEVGYLFHNIFGKTTRLSLNVNYDYVHWFFLTWEAYGYKESKAQIPTQNIFNADVTYSWHDKRYSLGLECTNIFDCTAYDSYRLQKPGRAFNLTFRMLLQ